MRSFPVLHERSQVHRFLAPQQLLTVVYAQYVWMICHLDLG